MPRQAFLDFRSAFEHCLSDTSHINCIFARWPDKPCLSHDMYLYNVNVTLHFLISSVPDSSSRTHVESLGKPCDLTSILEVLFDKLHIKIHLSSILFMLDCVSTNVRYCRVIIRHVTLLCMKIPETSHNKSENPLSIFCMFQMQFNNFWNNYWKKSEICQKS